MYHRWTYRHKDRQTDRYVRLISHQCTGPGWIWSHWGRSSGNYPPCRYTDQDCRCLDSQHTHYDLREQESHRHHIKSHIKNWSEFTLSSGAMWLRAELSSELFPSSHVTYFWRHHCLFPVKHESCCFFLFYQLWYLSNSNMRWDMSDTHSPTHCCVGVCRYPGLHSQRKLPGTFRQTAFCWHTGPFWHSSISTHTRHKHT